MSLNTLKVFPHIETIPKKFRRLSSNLLRFRPTLLVLFRLCRLHATLEVFHDDLEHPEDTRGSGGAAALAVEARVAQRALRGDLVRLQERGVAVEFTWGTFPRLRETVCRDHFYSPCLRMRSVPG